MGLTADYILQEKRVVNLKNSKRDNQSEAQSDKRDWEE